MDIPEKIIKYANQCTPPQNYVNSFLNAWKYPTSLQKAIYAHCIDCMGFEDVYNRVRECTCETCSLHKHRPYQSKETENTDSE